MYPSHLPLAPANSNDIPAARTRTQHVPASRRRKRKRQNAVQQNSNLSSPTATSSQNNSPSPADSVLDSTSPSIHSWQPPEPPGHRQRMAHFNSLLRTHPYNIHGDLYTSTTTSYLLLLTAALMESQSASDPSLCAVVQHHASQNLEMVATSVHECLFVQTRNLEEHLRSLRILKRVNPHWRVDGFNFCVDLKPEGREAEVWLTSRGTGDVGEGGMWGSWRESVSVVFWRREARGEDGGSVWTMYKHVGIRGPGGGMFPWCGSEEWGREGGGARGSGNLLAGLPGCEGM